MEVEPCMYARQQEGAIVTTFITLIIRNIFSVNVKDSILHFFFFFLSFIKNTHKICKLFFKKCNNLFWSPFYLINWCRLVVEHKVYSCTHLQNINAHMPFYGCISHVHVHWYKMPAILCIESWIKWYLQYILSHVKIIGRLGLSH